MPPDLRFESELQTLRQRRQGLREARLSHPRPRLVADVELCLREARERSYAANKSKQQMEHFLRRCRLEVGAARAAFEQDVKRHEAVFKNCEADRARRKAEAKQFRVVRPAKLVPAAPATLSSAEQVRAFDSWEDAFARFEASSAHADWGLHDVPWPPAGSCVTGIRVGDSTEAQRQRLKLALLRWHPDKFFSRNGSKLLKCDAADIMERVHAMLDQVQEERRIHRPDGGAQDAEPPSSSDHPGSKSSGLPYASKRHGRHHSTTHVSVTTLRRPSKMKMPHVPSAQQN